jgi:subtilisin family serine protease
MISTQGMRPVLWLLVLGLALVGASSVQAQGKSGWESKVDPTLLQRAGKSGTVSFMVRLAEQADLSGARNLRTKEEKAQYVYTTLQAVARRTQVALRRELDAAGVDYQAFWVTNALRVTGTRATVQAMAERADVAYVYHNDPLMAPPPLTGPFEGPGAGKTLAIEWNITKVNADDVWNLGFRGQGAVVGGQDTGYDWDHPALKGKYRGWNGTSADHNYHWHDAIHTGSNPQCGLNSPVPCDDNGHGTHTMGTMIGDDGGANQIGMAPDAKWIGCRNMNQGIGTLSTYIECFEWFVAPTDISGQNPDPTKSPHVINNSWSCPTSEGCNTSNFDDMETALNALRAAGTFIAVSAGNSGSSCSTVNTPAAIFDGSFTVGSTNSSDNISSFSSRGPVTVDGSGRMKPDISAPGESVRSSYLNNTYATLSGTSMAGPHVAGLVALLISASPDLAGNVDSLEAIIRSTAVPRTTTNGCGGDSSTDVPNNTYGWGRIDALAAVNAVLDEPPAEDIVIDIEPIGGPIVLPPSGGSFQYTVSLTNNTTTSQTIEYWVAMSGPTSSTRGPFTTTVASGATFTRTFTQRVRANAPAGTYTQTANFGDFPSVIDGSDSFQWTKSASKGGDVVIPGADLAAAIEFGPEEEMNVVPERYLLAQNYPNPFNPATVIAFDLPQAGQVNLQVYNLLGQVVATLVQDFREAGHHEVVFEADHLSAGTYLYVMRTDGYQATRRMTLLK